MTTGSPAHRPIENLEIDTEIEGQHSLYSDEDDSLYSERGGGGSSTRSNHNLRNPSNDWDDEDVRPLVGGAADFSTFDYDSESSFQSTKRAWRPVVLFGLLLGAALLAAILYVPSPQAPADPFLCPTLPAAPLFWNQFESVVQKRPQAALCWDVTTCRCPDPTVAGWPNTPQWKKDWDRTVLRNAQLINATVEAQTALDVVLLGDSITEHWLGTKMAVPKNDLRGIHKVYREIFDKQSQNDDDDDSAIQGLALGVSGDRTPQILARIQQSERLQNLNTKIVWLLVGTNDYKYDKCNVESILAGQIAIVKEIQLQLPEATVVLNSVLPRDDLAFQNDYDALNRRLACLAETTPRVQFFNATGMFLTTTTNHRHNNNHPNGGQRRLNNSMFLDKLHPSELGSRVFGAAIRDEVVKIEGRRRRQ